MSKPRLVVVGAGWHGRELFSYIRDVIREGWDGEFIGYLDDAAVSDQHSQEPGILGKLDRFLTCPDEFFDGLEYLTAFGNNATRQTVVDRLNAMYGGRLAARTLVHPASYVGYQVQIGEGSCLAPGAIATRTIRIGKHCILNVKASVSHDCVVGDFVNVNPGATICGNVSLGEGAYIGAGATVKDKVSIGAWSVIGAGATVIDDIPPNVTATGTPARIINQPLGRS
jgi:acetyltransferase EpsM